MRCPSCRSALSLAEYAWRHRHPTALGRRLGAAMMVAGAIQAGSGLLVVTGVVQ